MTGQHTTTVTRKNRKHILARAAAILALLVGGVSASYAGSTWDAGGGANTNWSEPTNWDGDAIPVNDGTADIVFPNVTLTGTLDVDYNVNSFSFAHTNPNSLTMDGSNTLTLQSGNFTATTGSGAGNGPLDWDPDIVQAGSGTWSFPGGSANVIFRGDISGAGKIDLFTNRRVTIASTGSLSNTGGIEATGSGILELQAPYTGGGDVTLGSSVRVQSTSATPFGTSLIIFDGGGFDNVTGTNPNMTNDVQLTANGVYSTWYVTATTSGTATLLADTKVRSGNRNATLVLNGTVTDGGNGYGITVYDDGDTDVRGGLNLGGTGNFSGDVTLSSGTLGLTATGAAGSGDIILGDAGTGSLDYFFAINPGVDVTNDVHVTNNGTGAATIGNNGTAGGTITLSGDIQVDRDVVLLVDGQDMVVNGSLSGTAGVTIEREGDANNRNFTLNAASPGYSGTVTFQSGNLTIGAAQALGTGTVVTAHPSGSNRIISDGGNYNLGNAATINNDLSMDQNSGYLAMGDGTITDDVTFTISAGNQMNFASMDESGGSYGITKEGDGTLGIGESNTYTGTTTVNNGTLLIKGNGALGDASSGTTVASGATLAIIGGVNYSNAESVTLGGTGEGGVGALRSISGNNTFAGDLTTTSATRVAVDADRLVLQGDVLGGFDVEKTGGGMLELDGNTVTGNLDISSGGLTGVGATIDGNLDYAPSTGSFAIEILAQPAGFTATSIAVNGTVDLGGGAFSGGAVLTAVSTASVQKWQKLFIVVNDDTDAISGEFLGVVDGSLINLGGAQFATISYFGNSTTGEVTGGNDIVLYNFTNSIPEPATMSLLVLGGLMLGQRRRRQA